PQSHIHYYEDNHINLDHSKTLHIRSVVIADLHPNQKTYRDYSPCSFLFVLVKKLEDRILKKGHFLLG
ncbi:MAG: hypothetical protein P8M34_01695, partial [Saprospiraceae bacterium]|nr:hypothetical protein [Saprospiraceae bacterium]